MAGNLSLTRTYNRIFSLVSDKVDPKVILDLVSTKTQLLYRMRDLDAIIRVGGRPHMRFTILKELPTATGYTDADTLTPVRGDPFTTLVFIWKQIYTPVQVSGRDMIMTDETGDGITDMLTGFIEAAVLGMREGLGGNSVGLFSSISETDERGIAGLQTLLPSSATAATVGQLARSNHTGLQHNVANVSSDFSANGLARFRTLYRQCCRFDENVDTVVLNGSTLDNLEAAQTATLTTNLPLKLDEGDKAMLDSGFYNIRYKNALVFDDDGVPANFGYFLNIRKYLRLFVRIGRDVELQDFVKSREADDLVSYVLWAGGLALTNPRRNGVLLNGDTD